MKQHSIRIIGGRHRGRKISVADAPNLRPTPNRIRETLFNWLQLDIQRCHSLEPFAGTGVLSLEALSRGAASATLLEKSSAVFKQLKTNCLPFKEESLTLLNNDALRFVEQQDLTRFNLLFLDPPFNSSLLAQCLEKLAGKLSSNTLLYIESNDQLESLPFQSLRLKHKQAGQVCYHLFKTT